ncbi:hypothetical protein VCHC52A1_3661, partial [Vibrio cholerae HC-52A1]
MSWLSSASSEVK